MIIINYIGKIPNIVLNDKYGIVVDELNYELVTLKTKIVSESNIKTINHKHENDLNSYKIGDIVYEWVSCNKYGSTLDSILNTYIEIERRNLIMHNQLQPLENVIEADKQLREKIKHSLSPLIVGLTQLPKDSKNCIVKEERA